MTKNRGNNKAGSRPPQSSPTARRPVGSSSDKIPSPIKAADRLSSISVGSLQSALTSPTDTRTPTSTKPAKSEDIQDANGGQDIEKTSSDGGPSADDSVNNMEENPVLPMTPKSPDPRSPTIAAMNLSTEKESIGFSALPARSAAVVQDMAVVEELLDTMKQMLGTLGATFDSLGEQTMKVATLPAAIDAVHQVSTSPRMC